MPRVRRKSLNDIYFQTARISRRLRQRGYDGNTQDRLNRVGQIYDRYAGNILRRQGLRLGTPNWQRINAIQTYTRNQYAGQGRGSTAG